MDSDTENVEDDEKYSFLLGSALRNEDPEQFLSVYDAILPKDLPDTQVWTAKTWPHTFVLKKSLATEQACFIEFFP